VKIIQIDVSPEEFNTNLRSEVNLWGDIKLTVKSLSNKLKSQQLNLTEWRSILRKKVDQNVKVSEGLMSDKSLPLTYYSAFNEIKKLLPEKFMYIGEGANTMDIGRTIIPQVYPRTKLDAGTYGTMGVGIPQAMAAKIVNPELPVFAIVGDSAFGFSAMELETA
jgi:2-hydroxyacyl-CoA lyase 1